MNLIKVLVSLFLIVSFNAHSQKAHLTVGSDTIEKLKKTLGDDITVHHEGTDVAAIEIERSRFDDLHEVMHHDFKRCGGFQEHNNIMDAMLKTETSAQDFQYSLILADYQINQQSIVTPLLSQVNESEIRSTISKLSNYYVNRYYLSPTGYESSKWIMDRWKYITRKRDDVDVKFFHHAYAQPSVMAIFRGENSKEDDEEIIVLGGHLDSILGRSIGGRAPGADDNASGISTLTEVMRVLVENDYKPKRTIMFVGYAAEEVGLRGSRDIAETYLRMGKNVIGVIQFDMTLFNGSSNKISLTSDFTNQPQNAFVGNLIDEYVKVSWGYHRCGYGCSDHAAWSENGFPASNPFEASGTGEMNQNIHTTRDTLGVTNNSVEHVTHFVKLGLAYAIEMDRD